MPTNWVNDDFDLIQESGGNILYEDEDYVALQEGNSTVWAEDTATGDG